MKIKEIKTFEEFISFLRVTELTPLQTSNIINDALSIIIINDNSKDQQIESLIKFWGKWGKQKEKPLFLDIEIEKRS